MALELTTYGDLKKVIRAIALKQKGEKIGDIALGTLIGFIPGAEAAKTTFDFIRAAISKPDTKKTKTWLDKLDIDDEMSAIVDDTVENGFMQMMSKTIESKPDTQELEPDFNMNAEMVNYLKDKYEGRTVSGIQENREMDLKEYIKELVRKEMDEMSVSGDAGPYSTPIAFAKKGQKTNAAIQTAQSQGMKLVPKGMPKNSKALDYKELWKGKKSSMNENVDFKVGDKVEYENQKWEVISFLANGTVRLKNLKGLPSVNVIPGAIKKISESNYDKVSQQGQPSEYSAPSGYTAASGYTAGSGYDKNENMKESLLNIIDKELINEVTYGKFKKDVKHRTKSEQLHKAIREVKKKLAEIDRIVEYTSRMKQELSEDGGINYWKATQKNVATISEMVNQLNNKIKNLNQ
jgi:hypothetical protein